MNSLCLAVPVALWLLDGGGVTLPTQERAADLRLEIDRLAYQIDESVRQVCRPSPLNLFGPAQLVRGYRIPGVGVVFVVPPRSLPGERVARARGGPANRPTQRAGAPAPAPREPRSARAMPPMRRATVGRPSDDEQAEMALRAFEEQVRTMDEAAARMHQGVQQAMTEMMRDVQQGSARDDGARGTPGEAGEGFPPLLLLPPWNQSWGSEAPADPRSVEEVLRDVRTALAKALTTGALAGLPPDEALVATVEFFTENSLDPSARPAATLVERLRVRDIEAHERGALSKDDLVKRVEISQF